MQMNKSKYLVFMSKMRILIIFFFCSEIPLDFLYLCVSAAVSNNCFSQCISHVSFKQTNLSWSSLFSRSLDLVQYTRFCYLFNFLEKPSNVTNKRSSRFSNI